MASSETGGNASEVPGFVNMGRWTNEQLAAFCADASNDEREQQQALTVLHNRIMPKLVASARHNLQSQSAAEEAASAAFWQAWRNIEKYDPSRSFSDWIHFITLNKVRDEIRRRKRAFVILYDDLSRPDGPERLIENAADPFDVAREHEDREHRDRVMSRLDRAAARMTPEERMIINRIVVRGWTKKRTCEELGIRRWELRDKLDDAMARFREFAEEEGLTPDDY